MLCNLTPGTCPLIPEGIGVVRDEGDGLWDIAVTFHFKTVLRNDIPKGRRPPPGFGIITRKTGRGLYALTRSSSLIPDNHSSNASDSTCSNVTPSTPAEPSLALANALPVGAFISPDTSQIPSINDYLIDTD